MHTQEAGTVLPLFDLSGQFDSRTAALHDHNHLFAGMGEDLGAYSFPVIDRRARHAHDAVTFLYTGGRRRCPGLYVLHHGADDGLPLGQPHDVDEEEGDHQVHGHAGDYEEQLVPERVRVVAAMKRGGGDLLHAEGSRSGETILGIAGAPPVIRQDRVRFLFVLRLVAEGTQLRFLLACLRHPSGELLPVHAGDAYVPAQRQHRDAVDGLAHAAADQIAAEAQAELLDPHPCRFGHDEMAELVGEDEKTQTHYGHDYSDERAHARSS